MLRLSLNTPQTFGAQLSNPNRSNWGGSRKCWGRVLGEIEGTKALLGLFWGTSIRVSPGSTLQGAFRGNSLEGVQEFTFWGPFSEIRAPMLP